MFIGNIPIVDNNIEKHSSVKHIKHNVKKDWIEQRIAELTKEYILRDDVIAWIAENAIEFQRKAGRSSEITSMEKQLSESKKAAKNIVAAIEQGIITASTRTRLLELEDEIANLERSLAVARAAHQPLEKERILYFLESFRDGDVTSKEYQAKIINTFVREVYLWDDKIGIDYYYMGGKNTYTYDLVKADDVDIEAPGEFAYSPLSPTIGEPYEHQAVIYLTAHGFVLLCPL